MKAVTQKEIDLAAVNLLDPDLMNAPYDFYAKLRREAPVWEVPGTRAFLVASWDLVVEAVARTEDFSSNLTGILVRGDDGRPAVMDFPLDVIASAAIATADPPVHGIHRKLAQPGLSPISIAKMETSVVEAVDRLSASAGSGWWRRDGAACRPLPALVVTWILGFPAEDAGQIMKWGVQGGDLLHGTRTIQQIAEILPETVALSAYIIVSLSKRGADPIAG